MSLYSILVDIAANTANFQSSIKRAEDQIQQFGETVKSTLETIGVGVGLEELAEKFNAIVEQGEGLVLMSQKIGMSVESLSRLQYAAQQTGIATEDMNTGLERFARAAGEAAGGSVQYARAFQAMHIELKDSTGNLKPMSELLDEVADKFASYQDGTAKAALAQQLFGRSGADLIPLLDQGRAGIEKYGQQLDALGDTMTQEGAEKAEEFKQSLNDVDHVLHGVWQTAVIDLLPGLTALDQEFTAGATSGSAYKDVAQAIADVMKVLASVVAAVGGSFGAATKEIEGFGKGLKDFATSHWVDAYHDVINGNAEMGADLENTAKAVTALWAGVDDQLKEVSITASKVKTAAPIVQMTNGGAGEKKQLEEVYGFYSEYNDKILELATTREEKQENLYLENRAKLDAALEDKKISWARYVAATNELVADQLKKPGETKIVDVPNDQKDFDALTSMADQAARNIQTSFANFLFDPFKGGLKGMAVAFLNTLRKMLAEAAAAGIFKALFGEGEGGKGSSGLGGAFGTLLKGAGSYFGGGGSGGGGSSSTLSEVVPSVVKIGATIAGALAGGGDTNPGSTYLVGEDGPELFTPSAHGTVIPNDMLGGGATFSPTYHIDARGVDADRVMTMLPPLLARHGAQMKADMLTAFRRSGLAAPLRA